MNKDEYWSLKSPQNTVEYKFICEKLQTWKTINGITKRCVVHHRDDTEECRKYNDEHYELWGFNLDGTFEYGKYVIFMTASEHIKHHHIGKPSVMKGKTHTDEAKTKISENNARYWKGKKLSPTHIQHLRENHANVSVENNPFYGKHHSDAAKEKMSAAKKGRTLSDVTKAKIGAARKEQFTAIKFMYNVYKNNGGVKRWNDFQKALKNGEITFEM